MNNYPEVLFISWNRSLVAFVEIDLWDTWSGLKQRMRIKWESDQKKKRTIILLTIEWHWDKNWEKEDHLSNDCWRTYHFCMLEIFFFFFKRRFCKKEVAKVFVSSVFDLLKLLALEQNVYRCNLWLFGINYILNHSAFHYWNSLCTTWYNSQCISWFWGHTQHLWNL